MLFFLVLAESGHCHPLLCLSFLDLGSLLLGNITSGDDLVSAEHLLLESLLPLAESVVLGPVTIPNFAFKFYH